MSGTFQAFNRIKDSYRDLPKLDMSRFSEHDTVLIITDMINGFAHFGPLSSPRVAAIAAPIAKFGKQFETKGIKIIAFADAHSQDSPEFSSYPPHCMAGTDESKIVPEIAQTLTYQRIDKGSTNGYLEPRFQALMQANQWTKYVIVGDCTDICINQLAVTLKTHYNRLDQVVDVIVPVDLVDTYDFDLHAGDLLHIMGLYMMQQNGVELVKWEK